MVPTLSNKENEVLMLFLSHRPVDKQIHQQGNNTYTDSFRPMALK